MSLLEIVKFPDKRLRLKSDKIETIDNRIRNLINNMIDTMYEKNGLGLAAIQVGEPLRIFIIDWNQRETGEKNREKVLVFINPEILECKEKRISEKEGCLSLPGISSDVERFNKCKIKAIDINGKEFVLEAEELLAIACQHENDHLNGILYIDRISKLKKNFLIKKYKKIHSEK